MIKLPFYKFYLNDKKDRLYINDAVGERNFFSKLKESSVLEIIKLKKQGLSYREISKRFNVCKSTVTNIIKGKTWKEINRASV